jgi:threonyl-tRNA synthetase
MRLAFVHADYFEFEARRVADREAAETDLPESGGIDGGLAVAVAVESADLADSEGVAADAAAELGEIAEGLKAGSVAVYPAPHLVDDPADPEDAVGILRAVAEELRGDDHDEPRANRHDGSRDDHAHEELGTPREVVRAPVGYDTAVEVSWKGHPTSEGSRRVTPGTGRGSPEAAWVLALPDGRRLGADEAAGVVEDPVLDRLGVLADDAGGCYRESLERHDFAELRGLTPRGTVVRDALLSYAEAFARSVGATPVRPSPTVDRSDRGVEESFRGRQPVVLDDGPSALDPGSVGLLDALSGRSIPDPAFPVARFARNGTVPRRSGRERHWVASPRVAVLEPDLPVARETFYRLVERAESVATDLGFEANPVVRVDETFETAHPGVVPELLARFDDPVPLEVRSGAGSAVALELGVFDGNRFLAGPSVELDPGVAERFGIGRADAGDPPVVVQIAPVGDVERTIAAVVAAGDGRDPPRYPTWLSPTQVRVIPVGTDHEKRCEAVAEELAAEGIRVDIDDRELTVGERIDRTRAAWVPYRVVVGDEECEGADLPVGVRGSGRERRLSTGELADLVQSAVGDRPTVSAGGPHRLGARLPPGE